MKNLAFALCFLVVVALSLSAAPSAFANEKAEAKSSPKPVAVLGLSVGLPMLGFAAGAGLLEAGAGIPVVSFVILTSFLALPSTGQWLQGRWKRALLWTGVRVVSALTVVAAALLPFTLEAYGLPLLYAGLLGYGTGATVDVISSYQASIVEYRRAHGVTVLPIRSGAALGWTSSF